MTATIERAAPPGTPRRHRWTTAVALAVALAAGTALIAGGPGDDTTTAKGPPARTSASAAWPGAQRADMPAGLADGPLFAPSIFVDATTAVGTAPTPAGSEQRLLLRTGNQVREWRRLPLDGNPQFEAFTVSDGRVFWVESAAGRGTSLWTAAVAGGPARRLLADMGRAVFFGNQYDLVVADGQVHWTAAPDDGAEQTEVRSVPVGGGQVSVRTEPGQWSLSAWPWLVDDGSTSGEPRLRNLATRRDVPIAAAGAMDVLTCGPAWCRSMVMGAETLARIDLVRPDGTERRKIAGGAAQSAITDVAVLDRFEVLAEPGPDTDVTGAAALVVYDIATGRTVDIAPDADGAFARGGMLWWSTTKDDDDITWHTLDLRTV
ncbi:hypothetical protein Aab01nite_85150 [Paractinoplanes abujensis]|uniref:Uncharacterized protein n=1 Tax=Paractinoplanes abujensis TaxID=882441 RepID=A0A7W7CL48_9ACTN|nr:hypothetical protein [Actinoplanes abujensis]MBB4690554.1 hypothetical protein [Actinoplanes abujensis]GID24925.1 hypothetical protein Aab01nite_85150 [Actinoplanes abujensis]